MYDKEYIPELKNGINGKRTVIQQGESIVIEGALVDGDGVAISETDLVSFVLTLYDESSGDVINNWYEVSIFDANNGVVGLDGTFSFRLSASDATIVNSTKETGDLESHIIRLKWSWSDGVATLTNIDEYKFFVQKTLTPNYTPPA